MKNKTQVSKKKAIVKKVTEKKSTTKASVKVGSRMPAFALDSTTGEKVSNKSLLGSRYVLYFYPKDMTSGCTIEAHEFTQLAKKFEKSGVSVFGISPDSIESHNKFIKKDSITFPLLADLGHELAEKLGSWAEKSMYGKKYMGINRSTFIVGVDGKIEAIYRDVKPEGHAVCVLSDITKDHK